MNGWNHKLKFDVLYLCWIVRVGIEADLYKQYKYVLVSDGKDSKDGKKKKELVSVGSKGGNKISAYKAYDFSSKLNEVIIMVQDETVQDSQTFYLKVNKDWLRLYSVQPNIRDYKYAVFPYDVEKENFWGSYNAKGNTYEDVVQIIRSITGKAVFFNIQTISLVYYHIPAHEKSIHQT